MAGVILSKRDADRLQQMLRWFDNIGKGIGPNMHRRRNMPGGGEIFKGEVYRVLSASTGYGVYNCMRCWLAGPWEDTEGGMKFGTAGPDTYAEVLNVEENDPIAEYVPALGKYDLLVTWLTKHYIDNEIYRVGIPLVTTPRLVRAKTDATTSTSINCDLILNYGLPATINELGYNITVHARIKGGGYLNVAIPQIKSGEDLMAVNRQGRWEFVTEFQTVDICDCYTAS
jgi:hypothetical protein